MAIFSELKIVDFPGLCVASLRGKRRCSTAQGNVPTSQRKTIGPAQAKLTWEMFTAKSLLTLQPWARHRVAK